MSSFDDVTWRKSGRSGGEHGSCVEVAHVRNLIGVRDSRLPRAGHLVMADEAFRELVHAIKAGDLDLS